VKKNFIQYSAYLTIGIMLVLQSTIASENFQLIEAVKDRDINDVRSLLKKRVDVNQPEADGTTALQWAAHWDELEIAKLLIKSGAETNLANDYGVTPAYLACTNKSTSMIELLLKAGADANAAMWTGETVLMNCARRGADKSVIDLVKSGVEIDSRESRLEQTALMWAAAEGHANIVSTLVNHGADITIKSKNGFTPLLFAARSGDMETARVLLGAGADPNEATDKFGNSLVIASAGGHEELSLYLMEQGADINSIDEYGITPLHYSIRRGMSVVNGIRYDPAYRIRPENMHDLTRALLKAGADPNIQIAKNNMLGPDAGPFKMIDATPFMLAAYSVDVSLMRLLADYEADPGVNTAEGFTPLMAAARVACIGQCAYKNNNIADKESLNKSYEAVKAALELGVDINATNNDGQTAMHLAAFTGGDVTIQLLVDKGASVTVSDKFGETPWSMASGLSPVLRRRGLYGRHDSTVMLLEKLGATAINIEEMDGLAPRLGQGSTSVKP
jgi:ankyrin repeat protein